LPEREDGCVWTLGQSVNLIAQGADTFDKAYTDAASTAAEKVEDDANCEYDSDAVNF